MHHEEEIDCIGDHLYALAEAPPGRLVLDFSRVVHMSTHMLGVLIVLHKRVLTGGGRLALCGLNPNLRETFDLLRLSSLFAIHATEEDALRGLAPAR
jgi:anti-anti-sigma factor